MFRTYLLLAVASLIVVDDQLAVAAEDSETRLNILFIAVDDLRTELGCYGVDQVHSPNIDQLAASGTLFERAYCQQAVCSPSRTSLMTGCRPDTTRVYDLQTHFRDNLPDVVTLPQHFKKHGYYTLGLGKIYHGGLDDEASWSEPAPRFRRPMYALRENRQMVSRKRSAVKGKRFGSPSAAYNATTGPAFESADVADNEYSDGAIADGAIQILRKLKDKPFFLAVGFLKPHLPFVAPKRYWDQYQADAIPKALNPFPPKDCASDGVVQLGRVASLSRNSPGWAASGRASTRAQTWLLRVCQLRRCPNRPTAGRTRSAATARPYGNHPVG